MNKMKMRKGRERKGKYLLFASWHFCTPASGHFAVKNNYCNGNDYD